jgi:hypothetical protein
MYIIKFIKLIFYMIGYYMIYIFILKITLSYIYIYNGISFLGFT